MERPSMHRTMYDDTCPEWSLYKVIVKSTWSDDTEKNHEHVVFQTSLIDVVEWAEMFCRVDCERVKDITGDKFAYVTENSVQSIEFVREVLDEEVTL